MRGVNENGGADALPLVVTITVNGTALPFEICNVGGNSQVAAAGAPLQVREILPVYPAPGII